MRATAFAILAVLAACAKEPVVIDGSTPTAFAKTTEKARRDLSIKDRLTFDAAIRNPGGRRYGNNDIEGLARKSYHGMTSFDVVADARERGIE